jgi:predicted NBD/HSP70 family sugar kinase
VSVAFPAGAQSLLRTINERAVLELIDAEGPIARPEVSRLTGLSKPTVSVVLASRVARGVVEQVGHSHGRKGPAAVLYRVDPRCGWAVGVDLGHDTVRATIADVTGAVRAQTRGSRRRRHDALVAQVRDVVAELSAEVGVRTSDVTQVVVSVPAVVGQDGRTFSFAEALPRRGVGFADAISQALQSPVAFENDVNLAALAELNHGHGRDVDNFVFLSLGTGVGVGVVIDGRLHRGASGAAGEVGYLPGDLPIAEHVQPPLQRDLVEATLAAQGIENHARARGMDGDVTPRAIFDRARQGDSDARLVVEDTARRIAYILACVVPVLDPALVVLGGGIGLNDDLLIEPVTRHLRAWSPFRPPLMVSKVGERAVLEGAVAMARDLARETVFQAATSV